MAYDIARDTTCYTASARCDTAGARLRHGHDTAREGATTPPSARHDSALCAGPRRWARVVGA